MTVDPFLAAPVHIQLHAAAACLAVVLGPVAIFRRRRDALHRGAGYIWVLAMVVTAVSSFWIGSFGVIGPFSPIHVLSVVALWSIWEGLSRIRRGDVAGHRAAMEGLYWRGLLVAGAFNFLPGRMTNRAVFGENGALGYVVLAVALVLIFGRPVLRRLGGRGPARAAA